jgi:hypothetical protein
VALSELGQVPSSGLAQIAESLRSAGLEPGSIESGDGFTIVVATKR